MRVQVKHILSNIVCNYLYSTHIITGYILVYGYYIIFSLYKIFSFKQATYFDIFFFFLLQDSLIYITI